MASPSSLINNSSANSIDSFVEASTSITNGIASVVPQCTSLSSSSNATQCRLSATLASNLSSLPDKIKSLEQYYDLYALSIEDPNRFWKMAAERLDWFRFPAIIKNTEFDLRSQRGVEIKWFEDGILNVSYNCLDRHIEKDQSTDQQVAFIFESDIPITTRKHITYGELLRNVKKIANVLKKHGVKKGDRVIIYMPTVVEACMTLLACARIGAIHSVVFGGFSSNNLAERISDCDAYVVVTSDIGVRGGKYTQLKDKVDQALKMEKCSNVKTVLVFQRDYGRIAVENDCLSEAKIHWIDGRDYWVHEEMNKVNDDCSPEPMNAEDPLFIVSLQLCLFKNRLNQ
jgi:acetyl-CoA synthetase